MLVSRSMARWLFWVPILFVALLVASAVSPGTAHADPRVTRTVRVPILMYHYVRVVTNRFDRVGLDLSVTPSGFSQQMALLYKAGFHTVTLDDLLNAIYGDAVLPPKPVILSFDDGYEDFYTTAEPIMARYGFKATSFIITGKVGWGNYLTWQQIKQLEATGQVEFESHSVNHYDMGHMSLVQANYQMLKSKQTLESELGLPVQFFCYPSGHYNANVLSLLYKDGYAAGIGTAYGTLHGPRDSKALTRVRIHGSDTLASFAAKLGISSR